jgi:hypothetical protein
VNKAVRDYMRDMQRRSAESRWSALSPAERSAKMKAVAVRVQIVKDVKTGYSK